MAHFAQLNADNVVTTVIVVANQEILIDGVESETKGVEFCQSLFGNATNWVQTSYNANFRFHFAGIGMSYEKELDAFIPIKCHEEAVLNQSSCTWTCGNEEHNVNLS